METPEKTKESKGKKLPKVGTPKPMDKVTELAKETEGYYLSIDNIFTSFSKLDTKFRTEKASCIIAIRDVIATAKKKEIILSQASVAQRIGWEKSTLNKALKTVNNEEAKKRYINGYITLQGNEIKNTKVLYLIKDAVKFLVKKEMLPTVSNVKELVPNATDKEIESYFKTITKKSLKELTGDLEKLLTRILDYKETLTDGKTKQVALSIIGKAVANTIKKVCLTGNYPEVYNSLKAVIAEREKPVKVASTK